MIKLLSSFIIIIKLLPVAYDDALAPAPCYPAEDRLVSENGWIKIINVTFLYTSSRLNNISTKILNCSPRTKIFFQIHIKLSQVKCYKLIFINKKLFAKTLFNFLVCPTFLLHHELFCAS